MVCAKVFQTCWRCSLYDKILVILSEIIVTQCTDRALRAVIAGSNTSAGRGSTDSLSFIIHRHMNKCYLEEILQPRLVFSWRFYDWIV